MAVAKWYAYTHKNESTLIMYTKPNKHFRWLSCVNPYRLLQSKYVRRDFTLTANLKIKNKKIKIYHHYVYSLDTPCIYIDYAILELKEYSVLDNLIKSTQKFIFRMI